MLLRLDVRSGQPIFEQIAFGVKAAVARAELRPGERLPSVRELAKELAINPNTVARAYETLEAQGVIVRRQGAGCFVSERPLELSDPERARRLGEALAQVLTEAFHLGFDADEVRERFERELERLSFPRPDAARERATVEEPS